MKIAFDADSTEHMTCIMNYCYMDIILLPEDGLPQWVSVTSGWLKDVFKL